MPLGDCAAEQSTQHYLGLGHGFGCVQSNEHVVFAVFEATGRDGNRVLPTAFSTKQLKRHEFSLGRLGYLTKKEFEEKVILPLSAKLGPLVGIARALVRDLREIDYNINDLSGRAVCVTDTVTADDYDAHAALGYSESQEPLTDKQKYTIRAAIQAELADTFGELIPIDTAFYNSNGGDD